MVPLLLLSLFFACMVILCATDDKDTGVDITPQRKDHFKIGSVEADMSCTLGRLMLTALASALCRHAISALVLPHGWMAMQDSLSPTSHSNPA